MVVSSELYANLSGNLLITYANQLFPSPAFQTDAVKQMFLTNTLQISFGYTWTLYIIIPKKTF